MKSNDLLESDFCLNFDLPILTDDDQFWHLGYYFAVFEFFIGVYGEMNQKVL